MQLSDFSATKKLETLRLPLLSSLFCEVTVGVVIIEKVISEKQNECNIHGASPQTSFKEA